jgi:hypothetical protein
VKKKNNNHSPQPKLSPNSTNLVFETLWKKTMGQDDTILMFAKKFGAPCQHSSPEAYLSPPYANGQCRKVFVGALCAIISIVYLEKQSNE